MSIREVFTHIYQNRVWGTGTDLSPLSGDGSLPENSRPYVEFVKGLISQNGITSVLDFGHGDWSMWRDYDFSDVSYLGVDVADDISSELREIYGSPRRRFTQIAEDFDALPVAELVITKEVLQHLSNFEIIRILEAFESFDHILICNAYFPKRLVFRQLLNVIQFKSRLKRLLSGDSFLYSAKMYRNNQDIETGSFHGIDLSRNPFNGTFPSHEQVSTLSYTSRRHSGFVAKMYYFRKVK